MRLSLLSEDTGTRASRSHLALFCQERRMASRSPPDDDADAAVDEAASAGAGALSFTDFLERMKDPAAADLVRSIRACVSMRFFFAVRLFERTRRASCSLPSLSLSPLTSGFKNKKT